VFKIHILTFCTNPYYILHLFYPVCSIPSLIEQQPSSCCEKMHSIKNISSIIMNVYLCEERQEKYYVF